MFGANFLLVQMCVAILLVCKDIADFSRWLGNVVLHLFLLTSIFIAKAGVLGEIEEFCILQYVGPDCNSKTQTLHEL